MATGILFPVLDEHTCESCRGTGIYCGGVRCGACRGTGEKPSDPRPRSRAPTGGAKVLPFVPRAPVPRIVVSIGTIRAEDGKVTLPLPAGVPGEPERLEPEDAMALAHAIETCAWTAFAQREDAERGRR